MRFKSKYMSINQQRFSKLWISNNLIIYSGALGLCHPLIAHGLTGDHDKFLTTPQFIMHTISLLFFVCVLVRMQNRTFQFIVTRQNLAGLWTFLLITPWLFWLGYYMFYVPFDILFMFLSIGVINAIQIKSLVKSPVKWIWQCILIYFLAALAGILIGLGTYLLYFKHIHGILRDFATWLSISTPAGIVVAYGLRNVLVKQLDIPPAYQEGLSEVPPMSNVSASVSI